MSRAELVRPRSPHPLHAIDLAVRDLSSLLPLTRDGGTRWSQQGESNRKVVAPLGPPLHARQRAYCTLANRNLVAPTVQDVLHEYDESIANSRHLLRHRRSA